MAENIANAPFMSVIIPNRNGAATIGECIDAALGSSFGGFEVIVVDDGSTDNSVDIIKKLPCRLVRLESHSGAAAARNAGARAAQGEVLFFVDADCIMRADTIETAAKAYHAHPEDVTGGTYTPISHDRRFFSTFQSLFINYSETKTPAPDYVASHAMVISKKLFDESGGFDEHFMPILEDVEFSHRLTRNGVYLRVQPSLLVEHVFNFCLWRSLRNAFRKSYYWTMYSVKNRDLLRDSGTASVELKANVLSWLISFSLLVLFFLSGNTSLMAALALVCGANLFINRKFIAFISREAGTGFALCAALYYIAIYPLAVGAGGFMGAMRSR